MSRKIKIFIFLFIFSVCLNIFLFIELNKNSVSGDSFKLINPIENIPIDSNNQGSGIILHYEGLRNTIIQDVKEYNMTGNVSIFIQDAKTGGWLGINEERGFEPASLLKIPIMMAVLKKVDRGEIKLDDNITLTNEDIDPFYGTLYKQGAGTKISVEELMKKMILTSDNTAKNALKRQLTPEELNAVFVHVGIPNPYDESGDAVVSSRYYTRLFKSLYFSTFLSPALSEKALDLATDTEENNLILKGVPPEVQVSHKFGVYYNELHDCGIVYHPKNPYFICIMTGDIKNITKNEELIVKVSEDTYNFVDNSSSTN